MSQQIKPGCVGAKTGAVSGGYLFLDGVGRLQLGAQKRDFQQDLANDPARFLVAVIHRRAGKTIFALDWLLEPARETIGQEPGSSDYRGYYICPYRNQAKAVGLDFLIQMTDNVEGVVINRTDLYAQFPSGARVQLLGADGFDKHRGRYADRVAFDESAQIPPGAWREVFRPMLADRKGKAVFIGTPRGHGFFYDLFKMPEKSANWSSHLLTAEQSGILDDEELTDLRLEMTDNEYRREMLCDWDIGIPGAYFSHEMDNAADKGRIMDGDLYDPRDVVHASWGLLPNDAFTVCYWQVRGRTPVLIDSDRYLGERVDLVAKGVAEKPYYIDTHTYRIDQKQAFTQAVPERLRTLRGFGFRGPVMARREWSDEVHLIRQALTGVELASENAADAVEALRQVHASYSEEHQTFGAEPANDWCYEYAVAVGAFAAQWKRGRAFGRRQPIDYPERNYYG